MITRILTPGTLTQPKILSDSEPKAIKDSVRFTPKELTCDPEALKPILNEIDSLLDTIQYETDYDLLLLAHTKVTSKTPLKLKPQTEI